MELNRETIYIISGPSGVGKTTTLRELMNLPAVGPRLRLARKVTTRALKKSDDAKELDSISGAEFDRLAATGEMVLTYERHGHKYGLVMPSISKMEGQYAYIQIMPAALATKLKSIRSDLVVRSIRLVAHPSTVLRRLTQRGDPISSQELLSRAQTVTTVPESIDYSISADRLPEEIAKNIAEIIELQFRAEKLDVTSADAMALRSFVAAARQKEITFCLFGGVAARIYGAERYVTDIDILIDTPDFKTFDYFSDLGVVGESKPKRILIGNLEFTHTPVRIGEIAKQQYWSFHSQAISRLNRVLFCGAECPIMSREDLIIIKAALQRGKSLGKFDIDDVKQIITHNMNNLDYKYITEVAEQSNVKDRVLELIQNIENNLG